MKKKVKRRVALCGLPARECIEQDNSHAECWSYERGRREGEIRGLLRAARRAATERGRDKQDMKGQHSENVKYYMQGAHDANDQQSEWCRAEAKKLRGGR